MSDSCERWGIHPMTNKKYWCEREYDELARSEDSPPLDSTRWWHCSDEDDDWAGYARIRPLQDLLDDDGRLSSELKNWTHDALEKTVPLWDALFEQDG